MSVRWLPSPVRKSDTSPNTIRPYMYSRYPAARIMTNVATAAAAGLTANVPTRVRNSPTKPDSPGSPPEAKTKKPNTAAQTGVRAASPDILAIVRSWVRS